MNGRNKLRDYYSKHIDNDTLFFDINSREELQQLEIEEFGSIGNGINWDKWDEVVQSTKDILKELPTRAKGKFKTLLPKFVYKYSTMEFLGKFEGGTEEVAKHFNVSQSIVGAYATSKRPYLKQDLLFSNEPIQGGNDLPTTTKERFKRLYVYELDTNRLLGSFNTLREAEIQYGLPLSTICYTLQFSNGVYKKGNLRFEKKAI